MPSKFTDNAGREWTIDINATTATAVRDELSINICRLLEDNCAGLFKLSDDVLLLVDVIYVVCREQADAQGVTDEQFGRAMAGDAIDDATTALLAGIVEFFPDPARRKLVGKFLAKVKAAGAQLVTDAEAIVETFDPTAVTAKGDAKP